MKKVFAHIVLKTAQGTDVLLQDVCITSKGNRKEVPVKSLIAENLIPKYVCIAVVAGLMPEHSCLGTKEESTSYFPLFSFLLYTKKMKLISWNVNGIRAAQKKGALDDIFSKNPDILAIQETKCEPSQLPENKFAPLGYTAYFDSATSRKGYSGVAIYTKEVPHTVEHGLGIEEFDHEGRMLTAHFNDFVFVTAYFPNGGRDEDHFQFKLRYYEEFLKKMNTLKEEHEIVIFCGDLNVAHKEIDIARPKENAKSIGFLPVERAWVDRVEESSFIDTFRAFHPETVKYSWWDQKTRSRERNIGWRIDYFFINEEAFHIVKKADILNEVFGSDHAPTVLDIQI